MQKHLTTSEQDYLEILNKKIEEIERKRQRFEKDVNEAYERKTFLEKS